MDRVFDWLVIAPTFAVVTAVALWTTGAIYFDVCDCRWWGRLIAAAWLVSVVALFVFWQPLWKPLVTLLGVEALFFGWWVRQKPSHDRDWDPSVALLPKVTRTCDTVVIENVRNFDYRSLEDFTAHYETRTYHLANLSAIDVIFFNWGSALMSHPVLVFDFGNDGRICISIEVRYRRGQKYSILRSLYHYFEIMFLVVDERDAILRRTKFRPSQEAHLYRLVTTPEERRATFIDYINAVNDIYGMPRWYHGLWANCTTTFYRLPSRPFRFDWRVLANARLDRALHAAGRIDRRLSFPQTHRNAYLNDIANSAATDGFGDHIRRELERRRHE